jgi:hypothetical protein
MSEFLPKAKTREAQSGKTALTERKVAEFVKAGLPEGKASAILWSGVLKGFGLRLASISSRMMAMSITLGVSDPSGSARHWSRTAKNAFH